MDLYDSNVLIPLQNSPLKKEGGGYDKTATYFNEVRGLHADPINEEAISAGRETQEADFFDIFMSDKQAVIDCQHQLMIS